MLGPSRDVAERPIRPKASARMVRRTSRRDLVKRHLGPQNHRHSPTLPIRVWLLQAALTQALFRSLFLYFFTMAASRTIYVRRPFDLAPIGVGGDDLQAGCADQAGGKTMPNPERAARQPMGRYAAVRTVSQVIFARRDKPDAFKVVRNEVLDWVRWKAGKDLPSMGRAYVRAGRCWCSARCGRPSRASEVLGCQS